MNFVGQAQKQRESLGPLNTLHQTVRLPSLTPGSQVESSTPSRALGRHSMDSLSASIYNIRRRYSGGLARSPALCYSGAGQRDQMMAVPSRATIQVRKSHHYLHPSVSLILIQAPAPQKMSVFTLTQNEGSSLTSYKSRSQQNMFRQTQSESEELENDDSGVDETLGGGLTTSVQDGDPPAPVMDSDSGDEEVEERGLFI